MSSDQQKLVEDPAPVYGDIEKKFSDVNNIDKTCGKAKIEIVFNSLGGELALDDVLDHIEKRINGKHDIGKNKVSLSVQAPTLTYYKKKRK